MLQPGLPIAGGAERFTTWRMAVKEHLNPAGSERIYRVGLAPETNDIVWRAGDIAEFEMPGGQTRSYSISSIPSEGRLDLLVREVRAADGRLGRGTAWLLHELALHDTVQVRIKAHEPFRFPAADGPLLLVGAGSGLAGLRPHILEAGERKQPVWLVYGEREADRDNRLCRELQSWHQGGQLYRLNLAFSRSGQGESRYVQDVITQYATDIRHYAGALGVVMTCGGVAMGQAVEEALKQVLGAPWLAVASDALRYRQALY